MAAIKAFLAIPWEDVIYPEIFSRLSCEDLINLQRADSTFEEVVRTYIEKLTYINCYRRRPSIMREFLRQTKKLKKLIINHQDWVTDSLLTEVIANNKDHLEMLRIRCCRCITPRGLRAVLCLTKLKWLDLSENPSLNDGFLMEIGDAIPDLEYIDVTHCNVSDSRLIILYQKCKRLKCIKF